MQPKKKENVTVLLVEDDEVDVMGVQRAFKKLKLNNAIVIAPDGQEALKKLRDGKSVPHPYLMLLDLNMPRMNGLEFLAKIRQDPELHNSIIFVLTTSNDSGDRQKAYQHNIAGYIVKGLFGESFINTAGLLDLYTQINEFP